MSRIKAHLGGQITFKLSHKTSMFLILKLDTQFYVIKSKIYIRIWFDKKVKLYKECSFKSPELTPTNSITLTKIGPI